MNELEQARLTLELVRAGACEGYLPVSWQVAGQRRFCTRFFHVRDLSEAASFAVELSRGSNVYVAAGLMRGDPGAGRGTAADISQLSIVTLDFDVGNEGHKRSDMSRPCSKHEVQRFVANIPTPTAIIDTGNGLLLIWVLEQPLTILSESDRAEATSLSKCFQAGIRGIAKSKFGWDFDKTADLPRLIRIAGTANHKSAPPKPVSVWSEDSDIRLTDRDLRSFLPTAASPANRKDHVAGEGQEHDAASAAGSVDLASVIAGCAFMEHWQDNAAILSEPEWKAGIDIAVRCEGGPKLVHKVSRAYAAYSEVETDEKIRRATEGPPPRTCENIANGVGFEGCNACAFRGHVRSPIAFGYQRKLLPEMGRRFVFIASRDAFFDLGAGQ